SEALECALNFSLTASVTNSRNGIPRSAARDFARRKMLSGISNVVFIYSLNLDRCSHIYGSESIARGSELVLRFFVPPSIRLLAVDIDGTLLNSQFHIAEGDINALQRAYDNGIEVILVTGRRHTFALPMARQLGFDLWLISSNGAITRSLTGETFHRDQLPLKTCRTLCHTMREFRGNMVITFDKESKGALVLESMDQLTVSIQKWLEKNIQYIEFIVPIEDSLTADPVQAMFCGQILRMQEVQQVLEGSGLEGQV